MTCRGEKMMGVCICYMSVLEPTVAWAQERVDPDEKEISGLSRLTDRPRTVFFLL